MVESRVGAGSTFTVILPIDPRTSADAIATGAVSAPGGDGTAATAVGPGRAQAG
jgi:hypothetical protein